MLHQQLAKLYSELNYEKNNNIALNNLLKKCKDRQNYDDLRSQFEPIFNYYKLLLDDQLAGISFMNVHVPIANSTDAPMNSLNVFSYATAVKEPIVVDAADQVFIIGGKKHKIINRCIVCIEKDETKEVAAVHAAILVASTGHKGIDPNIPTQSLLPPNNKTSMNLGVEIDYSIVVNQIAYLPPMVEKDSIAVASKILELKTAVPFMEVRSDWYSLQYRNRLRTSLKTKEPINDYFEVRHKKIKTRTGKRYVDVIILGKKRSYKRFNTEMTNVVMFKYLNASRGLRQENETGSSGTSASYRYPFFFSKKYVDVIDKLQMYQKIRARHPNSVIGIDGLDHLEMLYFLTNTKNQEIEFTRTRPSGYVSDSKRFTQTFAESRTDVIIDFTTTNVSYPANSTDTTITLLYELAVKNFKSRNTSKIEYKPFELRMDLPEYLRFNTEHTGIVMLCNKKLEDSDKIDYLLFSEYVILLNHFRNCYQLYRMNVHDYFTLINRPKLAKLVPPISFELEPPYDAVVSSTKKTEYKYTDEMFEDYTAIDEKAIDRLAKKQLYQQERDHELIRQLNESDKSLTKCDRKEKKTKALGKEKETEKKRFTEKLITSHQVFDDDEELSADDSELEYNPDGEI